MRLLAEPLTYIKRPARRTIAFVLAGGRGTRLQGLTRLRAKPATAFAGKYRIIDFTLTNCMNSGIRRVLVAVQYEAVQLAAHIQRAWGHLRHEMGEGVGLLPARQRQGGDDWYSGTADAVYQNLGVFSEQDCEYLLVLAGDHVYNMNYRPLIRQHADSGADITVGAIEVPVRIADQFGILQCDERDFVTSFIEKPDDPGALAGSSETLLASMGIYVFSLERIREVLAEDAADSSSGHDFGHDIVPRLVRDGRVACHRFRDPITGEAGYWRDVGTVDAYFRGHMELLQPVPRLNLYDPSWPLWSHERHVPPAKLMPDNDGNAGHLERSMLAGGSVVSGGRISNSILAYNTRVDRAEIDSSVLMPGARVQPGCRITQAVIDEDVVVPPGTTIGYDHDSDLERFHVTGNGAVLVTAEMLTRS